MSSGPLVFVAKGDLGCVLQLSTEGVQASCLKKTFLVSSTGNFNISSVVHMKMLRNRASVGNIGYFDNEFDLAGTGASVEYHREKHHPPQRV